MLLIGFEPIDQTFKVFSCSKYTAAAHTSAYNQRLTKLQHRASEHILLKISIKDFLVYHQQYKHIV